MAKQKSETHVSPLPPVVAVLGHVDHGKTSLLDAFRKSDVAKKEHGGITQRIGASSVEVGSDGKKRTITFIDTPGHEAFSKMRGRGAQAADIGLLIVSSVDGVMPQTKESISLLKEAGIPFIVVLTKSDLDTKNPQKVKQQLAKEGVLVEGMGGEVPVMEVSSTTSLNIKELLDLILLAFDMQGKEQAQMREKEAFEGIVIESRMDQKAGPRATIIVRKGALFPREEIDAEGIKGKTRTLIDDKGAHINRAGVGQGVEILGFEKVPNVGSIVTSGKKETVQKPIEPVASQVPVVVDGAPFFAEEDTRVLSLIICADTQGSLEAILYSLPKEVRVLRAKVGDISEADILFAKSVGAIVAGFNIRLKQDIINLAREERIITKNYMIIYELLSEIQDVVEGKQLALEERILGRAKILAEFPFEKTKVLGVKVFEGRMAKGDKVVIVRDEKEIGKAVISSVRQGKNQVSKIEKGQEGGIILSPFLDFMLGDMVVSQAEYIL